ncbi:hypothetical protein DPMN_121536, partial [Dreissena polymorpha]
QLSQRLYSTGNQLRGYISFYLFPHVVSELQSNFVFQAANQPSHDCPAVGDKSAVLWKQGKQSFGIKTKIHSDLNVILELSEHLDMPSSPARQQKKMNNELDQSLTNPDTSALLEFKRNDVVYSVPHKTYAPVAAEVVQQEHVLLTDIAADSKELKVGGQDETGQESEDSEEEDVGLEMHAIEPTEEDLWQGSMEL